MSTAASTSKVLSFTERKYAKTQATNGVRGNETNCGKTHQSRFGNPDLLCPRRVVFGTVSCKPGPRQETGGRRKDTVRLDQTFGFGKVGQRMVPERWITPATQTNELAGPMTLSRLWACLK